MGPHLFVDESRRGSYLLCAAVVPSTDLVTSRRFMRNLKPSNKNRIHMQDEGPAVRNQILAEFCRTAPISEAHVYIASVTRRSERQVRDDCFHSLTLDALKIRAARLVIETCDQDRADSKVIGDTLAKVGRLGQLRWDHETPTGHEMLWAADIIAWAYGSKQRSHRELVDQFVIAHDLRPRDARRPGDP